MRYAIAPLIILPLLLGACATPPSVVETGPKIVAGAVAAAPIPPPADNPYLKGHRPVPADAQRQFEQARLLIEREDWQGALQALHTLAQSNPHLSGPGLNLALVYQQLGDAEQAQRWFQQSITSNPANIVAYNEYGIFLRKQGRFRAAETIYLQALDKWEGSAETHRDIGILYDLYLGESDKALQHYSRYQSLTGEQDRLVAAWITDLEHQQVLVSKGSHP